MGRRTNGQPRIVRDASAVAQSRESKRKKKPHETKTIAKKPVGAGLLEIARRPNPTETQTPRAVVVSVVRLRLRRKSEPRATRN